MIMVGICDDEADIRAELRAYCMRYFEKVCEYRISEYSSGMEVLEDLKKGRQSDILLLDIEMKGIDGIQLKQELQRQRSSSRILYITNHEELAKNGYGKNVFAFLSKPLSYNVFSREMDWIVKDLEQTQKKIELRGGQNGRTVLLSDILYIKASGLYSDVYLINEKKPVVSWRRIGEWETQLQDHGFVRSHRSYLVNLIHVKKIQERERKILLDDATQTKTELSRRRITDFRGKYHTYINSAVR